MGLQKKKKDAHRLRYSGIILHPTSLPGAFGIGDLGPCAYEFIDYLVRAGQSLWQVLPLGPTGFGNSPYEPFSAFAGQPLLISPQLLIKDGLLKERDLILKTEGGDMTKYEQPVFNQYTVEYDKVSLYKTSLFHMAYTEFLQNDHGLGKEYKAFCAREADWLEDYALYMALKEAFKGAAWREWPKPYRHLTAEDKPGVREKYRREMDYYCFVQFLFFRQWAQLKEYARSRGIYIIGDIPIFVSSDGADVWADRELFLLDEKGEPSDVAGVPPDYFSATGQRWGNPLYNWKYMEKTGFDWWIRRIRKQLTLCDLVRIDHFRGLEAYWAIPAECKEASKGRWVKGPGHAFLDALVRELGEDMPIIAEDLGIITPEVEELRDAYGLAGMKVLQFAFEGDDESTYLPFLYDENCVCYTGTHDNDTALGWYLSTTDKCRERARKYMSCNGDRISWDFIRTAVSSTARYALFPMQDVLGYGGDCRMNTPGTSTGNWAWRCTKQALSPQLADELLNLCKTYGRDLSRLVKLQEKESK